MKKIEHKNIKRNKGKHHTLYDFLPKEVIDELIEFKDPEYKKSVMKPTKNFTKSLKILKTVLAEK